MRAFPLVVLLLAGCAAPRFSVMVDSAPRGARVFWSAGPDEHSATAQNYVGQTPCLWEGEAEGNGTFKAPGVMVYSTFVPAVMVLTIAPPPGATNLAAQRQVWHCNTVVKKGDPIPQAVFFELK